MGESPSEAQGLARSVAESILASPIAGASMPPSHGLSMAMSDLKISPSRGDMNSKKTGYGTITEEDEQSAVLFVGDLARGVTEPTLRAAFETCGEVVAVDIKRDKVTNNNLGYGFVQFRHHADCVKAKSVMKDKDIAGRRIRLGWAQKNTTLFVGDLDGTITTQQLRDVFSQFGPLIVEETFVKSPGGKFGFVRYKQRQHAEQAKTEMHRKVLGTRPLRIGWRDNNIQKHCVHVQFNPQQPKSANLSEDILADLFAPFGAVVNSNLPRFPSGELKGYGFVHFYENEEGEKAAGLAIATLAESQVAGIPIRCSYGKRQMFNKSRRQTHDHRPVYRHQPWYLMGHPMHHPSRDVPSPTLSPVAPGRGSPGFFLSGHAPDHVMGMAGQMASQVLPHDGRNSPNIPGSPYQVPYYPPMYYSPAGAPLGFSYDPFAQSPFQAGDGGPHPHMLDGPFSLDASSKTGSGGLSQPPMHGMYIPGEHQKAEMLPPSHDGTRPSSRAMRGRTRQR